MTYKFKANPKSTAGRNVGAGKGTPVFQSGKKTRTSGATGEFKKVTPNVSDPKNTDSLGKTRVKVTTGSNSSNRARNSGLTSKATSKAMPVRNKKKGQT